LYRRLWSRKDRVWSFLSMMRNGLESEVFRMMMLQCRAQSFYLELFCWGLADCIWLICSIKALSRTSIWMMGQESTKMVGLVPHSL
jgi:hypothetical protein